MIEITGFVRELGLLELDPIPTRVQQAEAKKLDWHLLREVQPDHTPIKSLQALSQDRQS